MQVKVYTTSTCPYCTMAKDWLKNRKIKFEEVDVSDNEAAAREMMKKSGQMGVPVIDIDGKIVVGYDTRQMAKLLGVKE